MNKKIMIAALAVTGAILLYAKRRSGRTLPASPEAAGGRKRHLTNTFARSKNYSHDKSSA
jgi:hypothetical protein